MSTDLTPDRTIGATPRGRSRGRFAPAPGLLVTAIIGFAVVVATSIAAASASGVPMLSEATPSQFAAALPLIAVRGLVFLLAFCWGGLGVALVARRTMVVGGRVRAVAVVSLAFGALSVLAGVAQAVIPLTANGFSAARFGDTGAYDTYFAASLLTVWGAVAAAGSAALAVRLTGVRPGFTLALALVCLAFLIVDATLRGGIPPFAIAFVWLALGVGLRASRVPA